jgi:hypothetical protein
MSPVSAVSKAFLLLAVAEALDVEEVEDAARSENRETLFCKLDMSMSAILVVQFSWSIGYLY